MKKCLWLISAGVLLFLLGMSISQAQEVLYTPGPATGATNLQGLGFSWADVNRDGWLDLFVEPDNLVINNGGTSFTRVPSSGVPFQVAMVGTFFFDHNGDGYPDVLTTQGQGTPKLYVWNNTLGMFEAATNIGDLETIYSGATSQMWACAVGDYNGDNYVDIFWAGGVADGAAGKIRLLKGGPTGYESVGSSPRVASVIDTTYKWEVWNPCFIDANNDGYPDIFLPSIRNSLLTTGAGCALYLNNGNGTFSPPPFPGADSALVVNGVAFKISAIASAWGDYDNDGIMDLATSSLGGAEERGRGFRLLKGVGNGTFTEVTTHGITYTSGCRALSWGDYNNDGTLDLLQSMGFAPPKMWRNNGNGTFSDVTGLIGIPSSGFNTRSVGFIDYNSDGFLDFYAVHSPGGNVMKNGGNSNNWIAFRAEGAGNNKMGTTARFTVYANGGTLKQTRFIEGGGSGGSTGGSVWAQFGLDALTSVDSVVVLWADGVKQTFTGLAINRYWTIIEGAVVPATPVLASPANGTTGLPAAVNLSWNAAAGALSYRVQVSLDQTFADPAKLAVDATTTETNMDVALGLGATYYWRVYGINGGFTTVSAVNNFQSTMTAPAVVPVLVSPASGDTNQPALITLKVNKTADAAQYRWQVSDLRTFTTFFYNGQTVDTTNAVQLTGGFKYYWRVRGENGAGVTAYSAIDSFTTMAAPPTPALASPANNSQNVRVDTLILAWRPAPRAANYTVEVSRSSAGGLVLNTYTPTDTTLMLTGLLNQTTYYWRVRANNIGGLSAFSGSNSFVTILAVPAKPTLVAPAASATNVSRNPTFRWRAVVNASKYRLQVATDNAFANIVRDTVKFEDTTVVLANSLDAEVDYFWRVYAGNVAGYGQVSDFQTFLTGTTDVEELDVMPTSYALMQNYPNPFNPSTTISFDVPKSAHVTVVIYDVLGRVVSSLVDEVKAANRYRVRWDASNVSTGVYFYRMTAKSVDGSGDFNSVKKLVLMK